MRFPCTLAALALLAAAPLAAQEQAVLDDRTLGGMSFRGGLGFEPTQVVVGVDFTSDKVLDLLRMRPAVHLGFGDYNSLDASLDFLARLSLSGGQTGLYLGAAPTFGVAWEGGGSDSFVAATFLAGLQLPLHRTWGTSLEIRAMTGNTAPDLRLLGVINP